MKTKNSRSRAMAMALAAVVVCATALPAASYFVGAPNAHAQTAVDEINPRADLWRAVRRGEAGYTSLPGFERGVLINNGGQNWREMRNGVIAVYGGWAIIGVLLALVLFYAVRGKIKLHGKTSGMRVPRWRRWERIMHWYTAGLFIVLAITGLSLLFGRVVLIPLLGAAGFANWATLSINLHNIIGPFFSLGVLAMLLCWVKNNLPTRADLQWLKQGGGIIGTSHPSAGKANGGEKIWFWLVIFVGLGAVCISGFGLIGWLGAIGLVDNSRADMQFMHQIHAVAALLWIVVFFGHVYIGTIGTEGALEGMTRGHVSAEWAKQHHDLWYDQVKHQATTDADNSTPPNAGAEPLARHS